MTFLHASLLLGALAAVIPVALHMLGRRQPKAIVFPAIRFVRQTAVNAQRGWAIKRWLLLALRVLMVLLLALALASPRVQSSMFASYLMIGLLGILALLATAATLTAIGSRRSKVMVGGCGLIAAVLWGVSGTWGVMAMTDGQSAPLPSATGPICVAVVIDTSPAMSYKYHNVTRLEAAKEMAIWLMDRLPVGSQIAIVNSDSSVRLNQDRASANRLLDKTIVEGRAANLVQRISASIDALRKSDLERREIYVLTDLSAPAWRDSDGSDIPGKLSKDEQGKGLQGENVLLQLIDISVPLKEIRNWSLNNFKLSQQSATPGSQISVSAELQSTPGSGTEQMVVELASEESAFNPLVRDAKLEMPKTTVLERQMLEVSDGGSTPFRFSLKNLSDGTNHFEVRIVRPDPLDVDNVVFGTVEARVQSQTLVVADDEVEGRNACYAIDETNRSETEPDSQQFLYRMVTLSQLESIDLTRFNSMVLYEPNGLSADASDRIAHWVEQGGGLLIVLGPSFESAQEMMDSPIARLLPGKVKRITRRALSDRSVSLVPAITSHPIWSIFDDLPVEEVPWVKYAVFRHWDIEDLLPDASVLMRFTQSELPAVIEQPVKQGRIVTFAVPYPGSQERDRLWSQLYEDFPGFALFRGTVRYLSSWNKQQLNYFVDETAILENNVAQFPELYMMYNPNQEETRVESANESVAYSFTRFAGQYRMRGSRPQGPVVRGFSVNVNRREAALDRTLPETLDKALGKDSYRIAKERSEVQSSIGEGRYGRDLSPFLLLVLVMMLIAEQTMSSRFYAQSKKAAA
jgi:hypothetical protein